jgi:dihydrofolate reductase
VAGLVGAGRTEYLAWLGEQPEANYTLLMGATTYRVMSGFAVEGEPGTEALAGMSKVVFSTTLSQPLSWPNTQLVAQDPVEAVREMKNTNSKSMRTIGSLTLCRSLLRAGLVDRFRVVVFPVITGSTGDERIYDGYPDVALDMIGSRTFDGRIQLLEYVPTILDGPPGTDTVDA